MSRIILSIGIMAGTIIGAGVFSLPYIFVQVGMLNGLIFLAAIAVVMILLHLFYADLFITVKGRHNFIGLLRMYFGKIGAHLGAGIIILQIPLVLVIYLVLAQSFSNLIINNTTLVSVLLFWALGSMAIFSRLNRMAWLEFLAVVGMVGIMILIFVFALPNLLAATFNNQLLDISNFLLPMGPLFFALAGTSAVVHMVRELKKNSKKIRIAVILGTAVPAIIYAIFIMAVIVLSVGGVSADAISGLVGVLPPVFLVIIGFLGWLSIWTSYVAIGFDTNDILKTDLNWPPAARIIYLAVLPLIFYLVGLRDFIGLVSFTGAIFTPIVAILIIATWLKMRRQQGEMTLLKRVPWWTMVALAMFFVIVLIDQILKIVWPMLT